MAEPSVEQAVRAVGYTVKRYQLLERAVRELFVAPYKPVALDVLYKALINDPRGVPVEPLSKEDVAFIVDLLENHPVAKTAAEQAEADWEAKP